MLVEALESFVDVAERLSVCVLRGHGAQQWRASSERMQKRAVSRATVPVESALLAQLASGGIGDERRSGREGFERLGREA